MSNPAASVPQTRHTVTAVIVAHDGADVLPGLFRALAAQTHPVERAVGVDAGSNDRSGLLLKELLGGDAVLTLPRSAGFGEAVAAGLRHPAGRRALPAAPDTRRVEWVWLLHDDCEPAPDALERLIRVAGRDRTVVILGPKVLDGTDRKTLRETGISIDRAGRRVTGIETGEIDQGQHDGNRPVLAVGSAGMLVRRDVWEQLGGFDPRLKLFRDDIDFCWRAHAAGHRVHVVTDAVLYHRELSARPQRGGRGGRAAALAARPRLRWMNRRNALYVLAVNLPLPQMLRVMLGCVAGSLLRTAWYLLTKQEELAQAQFFAVTWLLLHPFQVLVARRRRSRGRREAYSAVRSYIPPGRTPQRIAETIAGLVTSGPVPVTGGRHQALTAGPSSGFDEAGAAQFTDQPSLTRRIITHPAVLLFLALLLVALIAERRLLAASPLGGGALVPAWNGASGLWSEYLAGFHGVGLGSSASAPPYLAVVAALGTILLGHAALAVDVLLLGCVPLAGITAYLAARRLVAAVAARLLLAAMYAVAPVAMGAVAAGRLGTAVAFVLLPAVAVNAGRMLTSAPKTARRAAWATGLLVAVAAAFAPVVWLIATVLAVVAVVIRRRLWPVSRVDAAIVVLSPLVLLFPWSFHLLASPSAFLAEAGVPFGSSAAPPVSLLLLLSPGGPGLPPAWVTAGLVLAVVAAFLPSGLAGVPRATGSPGLAGPSGGRVLVGAGWAVAGVGYLLAIATAHSGDGWSGAALAVTAVGLLAAAAPAVRWLCSLSRRSLSWTALGAAAALPLAAAGFWVTGGVRGPVTPRPQQVLPAFVAASSAGPAHYRTLVLRPSAGSSGGVTFAVARAGDPSLGEPELAEPAATTEAFSRQVAALVAPDGADSGDPGQSLASSGIHWVLLPGPVDQTLADRLNAASGLVPLSSSPAGDLWQVTGTVPRAAGSQTHGTLPRTLSLILELLALLVIVVLAIPGRREDPAEEAEAIAAVRAAQHERRTERAAKTRDLTRAAATRAMNSPSVSRAVSRVVTGFPSGRRARRKPPAPPLPLPPVRPEPAESPAPAPWEAPEARSGEPSAPAGPATAPGATTPVQPTPMQLIPLTPPDREGQPERGRRGGRHGKPRGRRKSRGGDR